MTAMLLPHVRRARDYIDRYYSTALTLEQLAAVAAVSKFHLVRCFAAAYGETPIRYLTRRRVERAKDLLRTANFTVSEVCIAVGFSSLGSFSARFKHLVGETPMAYRRPLGPYGRAAYPRLLSVHARGCGSPGAHGARSAGLTDCAI